MWEYGLIFGMLVVVGYWVFYPLFWPKPVETLLSAKTDDQERRLHQRKEQVYTAIKEVDFDHGMGKISDEDYQELTAQYKTKALEILKELETVEGGDDLAGFIEKEVERLRRKKGSKRGREGEERSVRQVNFCSACGEKAVPSDNFCRLCGMRLS